MAHVNEEGLVVTDEEAEYTEDDEYVTDPEGEYDEEALEEHDGEIEELEDEEVEEDDDAEEIRGLGPLPRSAMSAAPRQDTQPWSDLDKLPEDTQQVFLRVLADLKAKGRTLLTILLLGKSGVGKSSTGNALLGSQAFQVTPFQQDAGRVVTQQRSHSGVRLNIIDTPGLVDGDSVNERALLSIQKELEDTPVDVVLYLDRLDLYRVEPADAQAMEGVARVLGADIWRHTILALTRSQMTSPPPGSTYESFVEKRVDGLQKALQRAGAPMPCPVAFIENSSKCNTNAAGEKVLPVTNDSTTDTVAWLPALFEKIAEQALSCRHSFQLDVQAAAAKANPNRRNKLWIPVILLAQIAFKVFVLDQLIDEDGIKGDEYGPFDKELVEQERDRRRRDKDARKKQEQQAVERAARVKLAEQSGTAVPDSSEEDEDDFEESEEEEDNDE